jgi:DNA-binding MarR family transcriptional regulator
MVKKKEIYWKNRMKLLDAIKKDGDKLPISVLSRNIFSTGAALTKITDELEDKGFIVKEKYSRIVKTYITEEGERILKILKELNEVWRFED